MQGVMPEKQGGKRQYPNTTCWSLFWKEDVNVSAQRRNRFILDHLPSVSCPKPVVLNKECVLLIFVALAWCPGSQVSYVVREILISRLSFELVDPCQGIKK